MQVNNELVAKGEVMTVVDNRGVTIAGMVKRRRINFN